MVFVVISTVSCGSAHGPDLKGGEVTQSLAGGVPSPALFWSLLQGDSRTSRVLQKILLLVRLSILSILSGYLAHFLSALLGGRCAWSWWLWMDSSSAGGAKKPLRAALSPSGTISVATLTPATGGPLPGAPACVPPCPGAAEGPKGGRSFVRVTAPNEHRGRGHPDRRAAPPRRLRGRAAAGRGARRHAVTCPGAAVSGMAAMSGVWLRALRAALPVPLGLPAVRRLRTAAPRPAFAKELFLGSLRKVRRARRGSARAPAAPQGTRGPGCGCLYRDTRPAGCRPGSSAALGRGVPAAGRGDVSPALPGAAPPCPVAAAAGHAAGPGAAAAPGLCPVNRPVRAQHAVWLVIRAHERAASGRGYSDPLPYEPSGTTSACVGPRALNTCVPRNSCRFILCLPQGTRLYANFC